MSDMEFVQMRQGEGVADAPAVRPGVRAWLQAIRRPRQTR